MVQSLTSTKFIPIQTGATTEEEAMATTEAAITTLHLKPKPIKVNGEATPMAEAEVNRQEVNLQEEDTKIPQDLPQHLQLNQEK